MVQFGSGGIAEAPLIARPLRHIPQFAELLAQPSPIHPLEQCAAPHSRLAHSKTPTRLFVSHPSSADASSARRLQPAHTPFLRRFSVSCTYNAGRPGTVTD